MSKAIRSAQGIRRRGLIKSISALTLAAAIGVPFDIRSAEAADASNGGAAVDFHALSEFITGQKLDPVLAKRYYDALSAQDAGFTQSLQTLQAASVPFQAQGIDAMLATLSTTDPLYVSIHSITSAWYLGVVGKGKAAKLIAFYDALMFQPTRDYVFVPSYGGGPNSWVSETHILSVQIYS